MKNDEIPEDLKELLEECDSYYEFHKKSGLTNEEASVLWMEYKVKL